MSALDGWIDIFRAGEQTSSDGRTRVWTEADLDGIVAEHDRGDPAPVVVGHPSSEVSPHGGDVAAPQAPSFCS